MDNKELQRVLEETAALVEKSGSRFRIALDRERHRTHYNAMQKRLRSGERMLAYDGTYNALFSEFGVERYNIGQSSLYHAEALKFYARKAWRLALELQEVKA
jgi:uncharacterized membrane-anchored protein